MMEAGAKILLDAAIIIWGWMLRYCLLNRYIYRYGFGQDLTNAEAKNLTLSAIVLY
jgi:hypothetical protein